ncbi:MAG TPA: ADOP family duplicated permease [Longimicrobium sp.]
MPAALLRLLLPYAERDEVLGDLAAEHRERARKEGRRAASRWVWRQVLASAPALARRGWWRGWSGFEPRANWDQPRGAMFQDWGQDVKFSLRRLRRRPTYTALTVLTLALGVAGTAAVYGITRRLLLEPLPVRAEQEVAVFWHVGAWSEAEFLQLRPVIQGFQNLAAFRERDVPMQVGDAPARLVKGAAGTAELFQVLGVKPAMGPGFRPGDDRLAAEPVVVISHSLWRDLGSSPSIIGERIELGGVQRTVVGVMAPGFWFPDPTVRVWLAEQLDPEDGSGNWGLIGRTRPGQRMDAMGGELGRVMKMMHAQFDYPEGEWDKRVNPHVTPLRDHLVGEIRPALLATLAAMAVILLIACVNVAALMLGQVDGRGTELAVRSALGAGSGRLLKQLVVESLVIGVLAGLTGALLALAGFRVLAGALPLGALAEAATVDWGLLAAAIFIALGAATAVALVPGASVARSDLQVWLTRTRTGGIGGRGSRLEGGLVVGQVALVLLMVAGAGLLIRSVKNLRAIDPGVDVERVAVLDVVMPSSTEMGRRPQLVREIPEAVRTLPGVESAAATQRLPLRGSSDNWGLNIQRQPELEDATTAFRVATPEYFRTMGIRIRSGRGLLATDQDSSAAEGAVVINKALADKYFPGRDPVGEMIGFTDRWDRVVGVVDNVAESGLSPDPVPARYMTHEQALWLLTGQTVVIRMQPGRDPAAILDPARRAIQRAVPRVAIQDQTTLRSVFERAIGPARQVMSLLALLGGVALALGTIGVYGVVSHFVTRRRRDWAIRIALGMNPSRVVGQVVGRGGALVGAGIVLGLAGFLVLARLLASLLYGVGTADPLSLAGAAAILLGTGLLAAFLPARRASRIDPALALREQ